MKFRPSNYQASWVCELLNDLLCSFVCSHTKQTFEFTLEMKCSPDSMGLMDKIFCN
jgi:hypothetical protein